MDERDDNIRLTICRAKFVWGNDSGFDTVDRGHSELRDTDANTCCNTGPAEAAAHARVKCKFRVEYGKTISNQDTRTDPTTRNSAAATYGK